MAVTVTVIQLRLTSSHPLSYVTCLAFNVPFHRLRLPGDSLPLTTTRSWIQASGYVTATWIQYHGSNRGTILEHVSWENEGANRNPRCGKSRDLSREGKISICKLIWLKDRIKLGTRGVEVEILLIYYIENFVREGGGCEEREEIDENSLAFSCENLRVK